MSEQRKDVTEKLYYIQNTGYCGNCLLWWRQGGSGYTSDLDSAWKVTEAQATSIVRSRPTEDIMWPVEDIDAIAVRHVSFEAMTSEQKRRAAGLKDLAK